jgi:hypothetical protein
LGEGLHALRENYDAPVNPEVFINRRAFEAAEAARARVSGLPAQTEPLNPILQGNPPVRGNQGNPPLNIPPLNRQERARREPRDEGEDMHRIFVQRRNRPVRVLPRVRPLEAYEADDENEAPRNPPHANRNHFPQPQVHSERQPQNPAQSAARPSGPNSLPQRARAPRGAASVEVDNPRDNVEDAPPMGAPTSGPHMSLPKLELPAFTGEKGAKAQMWLESLGRFQRFYRMTDGQAVELARFSCKGSYAKTWAGMLPNDLTLETFKEHFKAEFAVENQDKLMSELLEKTQKGGVGEYATKMNEYFKMLQLDEKSKIRHFVRGLKFGIKETVLASGTTSLLMALRKAKEVETAYELSGKHRGPLDGIKREVFRVAQEVHEEVNLMRRRLNHAGPDFAARDNVFLTRNQGRETYRRKG